MYLLYLALVLTAVGVQEVQCQEPLPKDQIPVAMSSSRSGRSCVVNNRVYRHAQIFTIGNSRCIKYVCYDGSYYFHEEACELGNQCWPANEDFDYECRRYRCHVSFVGGGYKKYEVIPLSNQMCKSANGKCYHSGQYFSYVMNGQLKRRCTCRPEYASIRYYCYD